LSCGPATNLVAEVAELLQVQVTPSRDIWFACGEGKHIIDANVRGTDVYVFQNPMGDSDEFRVYDRLMMALHAADAARCADADRVTMVLPYLPGGRQDKRKGHVREGVSTGLLARMLGAAGVSMLITVAPHNEATIGCFDPSRTLFEGVSVVKPFARFLKDDEPGYDVVASPDVGGLEMARGFAEVLCSELVALSKERDYSQESRVMKSTVIGDPKGKRVLLVDDIVDTAGSVQSAVRALWDAGASDITVAAIHMLLSGPGWDRLFELSTEAQTRGFQFSVVGTSAVPHHDAPSFYRSFALEPLLADVVRSVNTRGSIRALE
jgi:ribose-phosphate pyrophosphokinase